MSPDYSSVQSCWRKPPPLFPNFFQVSNKFLRLLMPLTNSDKSISLKVSPFSNSNERLHKQKLKYHPFDCFRGCRSPQSWRGKDVHGDFHLKPCRKPYFSLAADLVLLVSWHLLNSCSQAILRVAKNKSQGRSCACGHHDCPTELSCGLITSLRGRSINQKYFFKLIFIFCKISTQELLNSAQQLLEIHQKNQGGPSTSAVGAGNPIPSGGDKRSQGCYEDCKKPSCPYSWGNGDAGPSPSSTHLDCICVISSLASPDGQMPGTGNGVACWCKCRQLSWLWERSQKAGKGTFCPK